MRPPVEHGSPGGAASTPLICLTQRGVSTEAFWRSMVAEAIGLPSADRLAVTAVPGRPNELVYHDADPPADGVLNEVATEMVTGGVAGTGPAVVIVGPAAYHVVEKATFLYRLLRPEHVIACPTPISSDVFSRFGVSNAEEHNAVALNHTTELLINVIPSLATQLSMQGAVRLGVVLVVFVVSRGWVGGWQMLVAMTCLPG